ncbi:MAG TPA: glycoside hydrolase family 2 protein, partial [Ignavibacteria bacterium]|nr:glycoside hydrolase family 2 protein [Ignavibacteria bacterium]
MKYYLHDNWKCRIDRDSYSNLTNKEIMKSTQLIEAYVPGTIHTDLLEAKIIPDPFYADNELKLKWINESDWIYQTTFDFPNDFNKDNPVYLHFDGLDTIAEIHLNDKPIAKTDNMFIQYEFDITGMLNKKKNKLEIKFISALKYGRLLKEKYGHLPAALNPERVYIRKAQYSFGWDWGPSFITCGIYRSVYLLQKPKINITNLNFSTISITNNKAVVKIKAEIQNHEKSACLIKIKMKGDSKQYEKSINNSDSCWINTEMEIDDPKLWYPNNYGEQNLCELSVHAIAGGENQTGIVKRKVGIRTLSLILENHGKPSFHFVVNGKPIFIKGANWIPADSFLPRVSNEKYLQLLKAAKNADMNMIRVWGGGVYENDIFYEICDELGLLVWQDFMFACASYPENDDFIKNVIEEIKQNVYRLQTHPSIAIWCGNNENEWSWYMDNKTDYKEMPGYKIYHKI